MNNRIEISAFGAIFVGIAVYIVKLLVRGVHATQMLKIAFAMLPILMVIVIASRRHWLTIGLAFWMISMRIPVLLFDSMTVGFMMLLMIFAIFVLERLITREAFLKVENWQSALLLLAGFLILARFFVDRPGSARLGGIGGLRHAVGYSMAVPLFFLTNQLARQRYSAHRVFRGIILISILTLLWRVVWRFLVVHPMPFYFGWFEGGAWFLFPMLLAVILHRVSRGNLPILAAILFVMLMVLFGVLSPFRSRVYFSVASFSVVFWCFGYRRRLFLWLAVLFCMSIPLLTVMPKTIVPVVARRALSTILPFDREDISSMHELGISASNEFGWTSGFRQGMMEMAIQNIRKKPWFGQGWSFTTEELEWAATFQVSNWAASSLITAGDYHNSLVTIAVKCGLPAAVLLAVALFGMLWHVGMHKRECEDKYNFILYAGLMGALMALFGQMLMNGGSQDLQAICAILGFLSVPDGNSQDLASRGEK